MTTKITVLGFKVQQYFFRVLLLYECTRTADDVKEIGVKTINIGGCIGDSKRANVLFEGPENVLYNIFTSTETKPIVEASSHILEETKIT